MEDKKERKEEEKTTRNFWISGCSEEVYTRFTKFCEKETNNGYGMGLRLLLDAWDKNAMELMMFEKIRALEDWKEKHMEEKHKKSKE